MAAWAGDAVQQSGLHPPFNLMLRLLVALCPDIIIPVPRHAGEAFVAANKPFESGEGITEDYSVQQHTSANTALQARLLLYSVACAPLRLRCSFGIVRTCVADGEALHTGPPAALGWLRSCRGSA